MAKVRTSLRVRWQEDPADSMAVQQAPAAALRPPIGPEQRRPVGSVSGVGRALLAASLLHMVVLAGIRVRRVMAVLAAIPDHRAMVAPRVVSRRRPKGRMVAAALAETRAPTPAVAAVSAAADLSAVGASVGGDRSVVGAATHLEAADTLVAGDTAGDIDKNHVSIWASGGNESCRRFRLCTELFDGWKVKRHLRSG